MKNTRPLILLACCLLLPLVLSGCPKTIAPKVLVLFGGAVGETHSYYLNSVNILAHQRLSYETYAIEDSISYSSGDDGNYGAIVISDYNAYKNLDPEKKNLLDEYCREFDVGIFFVYVGSGYTLNDDQIAASSGQVLSGQRVNPTSPVLDITRDGGVIEGDLPWYGRMLNVIEGSGYSPVAYVATGEGDVPNILLDEGDFDGVKRIFYGHDFHRYWLHDLLYLDSLQWLSPVNLGILKSRWIAVDIDDIFQVNWDPTPENRTVKIQAEDVEAMIDTQDYLSSIMNGQFRFHLGYNMGWYEVNYGPPPYDDAAGDRAMVEYRDEFHWFDHLPYHPNSTNYTTEELIAFMEESQEWAIATGVIDAMSLYQLSPYHAGISPIHDPLYEAWGEVWDARYTCTTTISTGFEHLGILVAPRQSCGIWSSQYSWDQVSQAGVDASVEGGTLFRTILDKPVSLFMTHQSNYARDRVGLYLFERLVGFYDQWTTFDLNTGLNDDLIEIYFQLYPLDGKFVAEYPVMGFDATYSGDLQEMEEHFDIEMEM